MRDINRLLGLKMPVMIAFKMLFSLLLTQVATKRDTR
jgi:hypothetical protein